jgi:CheY-like chemotaxis protein/two-component sensor histidine kinase
MILNYSRLYVGEFNIKPDKINISLICANLVKEFNTAAKNKSLDLSFQNNCGDTAIFADEFSISMAISNLIDNAIKYTTKGSVNVILHKGKNDDMILDVEDTGIGINQEYLNHIFEPYRQEDMRYGRAYDGIGLGLAIVKKVLDLNKCAINVESKKGEGTTFSINFGKGEQPLENKSKTGTIANTLPAPEELPNKLVLLVEDDLINQVTIRRFIENRYNVIITDSSDEAREIVKKEKIDIILMDISIKGSKNGLELTKELKESKEFSHIPIIAVTAHAFASDRKNSLDADCDSYLAKPFTKESLLNMIARYARN